MRLLKASSIEDASGLSMVNFADGKIPKYAILSHTWDDDEVLFEHVQNRTFAKRQGFAKVRYTCLQAIADDLDYVWIDSCCIDKSSSAELSEAINSMYKWYQGARICYAYLSGVSAVFSVEYPDSEFAKCRWFTRGWTLQELLAPSNLVFYSQDWSRIDTKAALSKSIADITAIDEDILIGARPLESASVAKRMSWAALRETTRLEDQAYCLMGMFRVNMPMLYGEGDKAFLRLQEEIMKLSDDQSLFAWVDLDAPTDAPHGLLAKSPRLFAYSNSLIPYQDWEPRPPYSMTNRGLCIEIPITCRENEVFLAALDCPVPPNYEDSNFIAIYLKRASHSNQQYARIRVNQLAKVHDRGRYEKIYVPQRFPQSWLVETEGVFPQHILQLHKGPSTNAYQLTKIITSSEQVSNPPSKLLSSRGEDVRKWVPKPMQVGFRSTKGYSQLAAALMFSRSEGDGLIVMIGSSTEFKVGFSALEIPSGCQLSETGQPQGPEFQFEELQEYFKPQLAGTELEMEQNRVRVDAKAIISDGSKYFLMDIHAQPIYRSGIISETTEAILHRYQVSTGRRHEGSPAETALRLETKIKKASIWKRLIS